MTHGPVHARLVDAAFALFDQYDFDAVTVDDIAERAGLSRTTFFRHFRTKEEVIFPDHDAILDRIERQFEQSGGSSPLLETCRAARSVIAYYIAEGERALFRFRMTSSVPALRDREIACAYRYQRTFRNFLARTAMSTTNTEVLAEVQAATVVTASNHVIRRWLRGATHRPLEEFDELTSTITEMRWGSWTTDAGPRTNPSRIIVIQTTEDLDVLLPRLRKALPD